MNNINRRRYVLNFRSFIYFFIFLFLIFFSFFIYINKNFIISISKNLIEDFSENFQYQLKIFDISGLEKIELKFIEDKIQKYLESSIFLLPLDQINNSIKENSWVKEIYLNTNYKDTLFIRIEEYKPIGIYYFNDNYFFFDENGKIIDQTYITDFSNQTLIIFKGNSSNLKANSIINILKNNDFKKKYKIESLEFVNKRRWDINLYNNVKLLLSEEDPNKSIQDFIMIQNKLSKTDINNIKIYDFRNLNKTILINLND
ncbi:FtsQ-type POTRA domain-containing protein [Pelagibacteraceae bacterium]|nr:FtsQ-type POTRA domain-containing protein [Pelagibacteraceae bacterium]